MRTNRPLHRLPNRKASAGLTLVEILITLLVISIGLLGVAGLHAMSLRNNYDALMRSHASALVSDIVDRMRANRANVAEASDYTAAGTQIGGGAIKVDKDSSQATIDVSEWKATLAVQLPEGDGEIAVDDDTDIVTVTIQWGERGNTMQFITQTEM